MDLNEAWKKLAEEKLNKPVDGNIVLPRQSKHPVSKLIRGFKIGMASIAFFEILYILLLFIMEQPLVKVGLVLVIIVHVLFFIWNFKVLRRMMKLNKLDANTKDMLSSVYTIVNKTLDFQLKISWGFFPLCAAAGFILGLSLEDDAATLMVKPVVFISLLITMAILTPIAYYLTRWMNNLYYGKYLTQLKELIGQTKEE